MNKKQLQANIDYLTDNGVYVEASAAWEDEPYSRELYYHSPAGGDLGICVDKLTREQCIKNLNDYDVNEECKIWIDSMDRTPFSTIKELYEDIEAWRDNLLKIVSDMPY